jgi:iron complex transport system ATP-binding protein
VLVSHHVEEIPPGFTHAMLLREGQVVAQGPVRDVIDEQNLSATFGMPLVVTHQDDRWAARRRTGRHADAG